MKQKYEIAHIMKQQKSTSLSFSEEEGTENYLQRISRRLSLSIELYDADL